MKRHVRLDLRERVAVADGSAGDLDEPGEVRQPLLRATAEQEEFVGGEGGAQSSSLTRRQRPVSAYAGVWGGGHSSVLAQMRDRRAATSSICRARSSRLVIRDEEWE